jgi:hypothetical protein
MSELTQFLLIVLGISWLIPISIYIANDEDRMNNFFVVPLLGVVFFILGSVYSVILLIEHIRWVE